MLSHSGLMSSVDILPILPSLPEWILNPSCMNDVSAETQADRDELSRAILANERPEVFDVERMQIESCIPFNVTVRIHMLAKDFKLFRKTLFRLFSPFYLNNLMVVPQVAGKNVYFMYTVYPYNNDTNQDWSYVFWFKKTPDGKRVIFNGRRQGDGFACDAALLDKMRESGLMNSPFQQHIWKEPACL